MSYLLIMMCLMVMVIIFLNRENRKLQRRASAELRYEVARQQLDEWSRQYQKVRK